MQGYMFAHMETWSRQGATKAAGQVQRSRKNNQRAWTVSEVLDEAERVPGASLHVGIHAREPVIWQGSCANFDELRGAHEKAANIKIAFPYTDPKTRQHKTRKRALRQDAHTLYSAVFSLPTTSEEALADPAVMARCLAVLRSAEAFERDRLTDAGGELAMAVLHFDEDHVHMHLYGLDRTRGSVNHLHPGKAANEAFRARHGALKRSGTTLADEAKRGYCDSMRGWQDDLHREVFADAGLMRFGPRRARLSRAEYCQRKAEQEKAAEARQELKDAGALRRAVEDIGRAMDERDALAEEAEHELDQRWSLFANATEKLDEQIAATRRFAEEQMRQAEANRAERQRLDERREALGAARKSADKREAALTVREQGVAAREAKADNKQHVAQTMIDVAKKVAAGDLEVAERAEPATGVLSDPAKVAHQQATTLFGRALSKLRDQARAEARAELTAEYAEIRAADDEIVRLARMLPAPAREAIAKARRSLTGRIMALGQMAKRQLRGRDDRSDER